MLLSENTGSKARDEEKMALRLLSEDPSQMHMIGDSIDRIFKNGQLVEERVGHNLVVTSFLNLVMALLKNQSNYKGITYWAVGSGAASWDNELPSPSRSATKLTNEIGRVAIRSNEIKFLDSSYKETNTPTNIIQVTHTFGTSDCNGVWREFGLFGGLASSTPNSGIMVNKRHHAVLTKTSEMTVERTMRFTLSLT